MRRILSLPVLLLCQAILTAAEPIDVWPAFAPGETTRSVGEALPTRPNEQPPITRVVQITRPTLDIFAAENPNGTAVLILPGGGFGKVVPDMEGAEFAVKLNELGITSFVLRYRTKNDPSQVGWRRPLQDAQRSLSWIREQAASWQADPQRVGLVGFSAGGQVAARLLTDRGRKAYTPIDATDDVSHRPDFAMLIYPWNIYDSSSGRLLADIVITKATPPTFLVHTDDDASTSLGSVLFYAGLKRNDIGGELHVYQTGGHGYGTRPRPNSDIGTWPVRAADWLKQRGLAN